MICVIPSRYAAERLPGKPLVQIMGRPMIQWVYESACAVEAFDEVLVATDDDRIKEAVESFGGTAVMTSKDCPSGSDRVMAALEGRGADIIVNVQGDEPAMPVATIETALYALLDHDDADVGTACIAIKDRERFRDPNVVKVARAADGKALYFSRSPIPFVGRIPLAELEKPYFVYGYKHIGIYTYRRKALEAFVHMSPTPLERIERLEQLRFMEAGYRIYCGETTSDSAGVDTPNDIPRAEEALRAMGRGV
ncbi:3-deoxy-manno-octulosonate cytidylyltransferase [bacterium]|nr:3-deoxy-manno-octulosonate cytidylyltransferase [bacterium]